MKVTVRHKNPMSMAYLSIRGANIRYVGHLCFFNDLFVDSPPFSQVILPDHADLNILLIDDAPKQNPSKYPAGSKKQVKKAGWIMRISVFLAAFAVLGSSLKDTSHH